MPSESEEMEDKAGYENQETDFPATPPAAVLEAENSLLKETLIKEDRAAVTAQRVVTQLLDDADAALKEQGRSKTQSDST